MAKPQSLGAALLLSSQSQQALLSLVDFAEGKFSLGYAAGRGVSIPHVTLFQGRFAHPSKAISRMDGADFSFLPKAFPLDGVCLWAKKIIFLNLEKNALLSRAHHVAYDYLFPLCEGSPADPQQFRGISAAQKESYQKTGYPFSLKAFLPHVTLGHLKKADAGATSAIGRRAKQVFPAGKIACKSVCLYEVGKFGACKKILWEKSL